MNWYFDNISVVFNPQAGKRRRHQQLPENIIPDTIEAYFINLPKIGLFLEYYHLIEEGRTIAIDQTDDLKSNISYLITDKVRRGFPAIIKENFRTKHYMIEMNSTAYSLLNEFAAYYFGAKAGYDFIPYLLQQYQQTNNDTYLKLAVQK